MSPQPFAFAQVCDPQIGMDDFEDDCRRLRQAVDAINRRAPRFTLFCGDAVDVPDEHSFRTFLALRDQLRAPAHAVPGNHDLGDVPTPASLARYRNLVGPDYRVVEDERCRIVLANSQLWKSQIEGESPRHHAWFRRSMEESHGLAVPVFVVMHHPPYLDDPGEAEEYFNLAPAVRTEILGLCREAGVAACLAGHTHRTRVREWEGMPVVTTATTSLNFDGQPPGFRWWEFHPELGLTHRPMTLPAHP